MSSLFLAGTIKKTLDVELHLRIVSKEKGFEEFEKKKVKTTFYGVLNEKTLKFHNYAMVFFLAEGEKKFEKVLIFFFYYLTNYKTLQLFVSSDSLFPLKLTLH